MTFRSFLLAATIIVGGCSQAAETAIEAAIAKNSAAITNACTTRILPLAQGFAADVLSSLNPIVAQVDKGAIAICTTADGLAAAAASATTMPWFTTVETILNNPTNPATWPAPVAPVSIAATISAGNPVTIPESAP